MITTNKEIELSSLLDSLIDFEIFHYSHPETPIWQKYEQGVGKSIINLLCIAKAASLPNIDEGEVGNVFKAIKKAFLTIAVKSFRNTKSYEKVQFGNGVTNEEKLTDEMVLGIFQIAIAQISQQKFIFLFKKLITFLPEEIPSDNADFKSILQFYMQKKRLVLPRYEVTEIEGVQHNQLFKVSCSTSDGKIFKGSGTTKKKAEGNAASIACNYYKINPKPIIITKNINLQPNYESKINYENQRVSKVFGLPDKLNLILAFLPPRLKGKLGLNDCNRRLAMVGATYIEYYADQIKLELFKNDMLNDCNQAIISSVRISENNLITIFETSMVKMADIPFKDHPDFFLLTYQSDCIQALFGMSFYHFINTDSSEPTYQTPASDWIRKVILDICRTDRKLHHHINTIALLRYQSIGFTVTRTKATDNWGFKIKHIRTGDEYEFIYNGDLINKKEVIKSLSGTLLKVIDRFEGVQFTVPKTDKSLETHKGLFSFLFNSLVKDKKQDLEFQEFILREKKDIVISLNELSLEELIELWKENSVNLITRAHLLCFIHKKMGINPISNPDDYAFLPAVYKPIIGEKFLFTIESEEIDSKSLVSSNKCEDNLKVVSDTINKAYPNPEDGTNGINKSDKNNIADIERKYKSLTLDELESFWKTRDSCFSYIEEAAIVFSLIRFERGIDFERKNYSAFLKNEIILKLELPSLINTDKNKSSSNIESKAILKITEKSKPKSIATIPRKSEIENNDFSIKNTDERRFSNAKVANRVGQSSFRKQLAELWKGCSISGCKTLSALDAAHIAPYRGEKDNDIRNGLLLRADLHRLFDAFLIAINPDTLTIHVSPKITDPTYTQFEGLKVQTEKGHKLSEAALRYHWFYFSNSEE